jgi:hypothetical protein
LLIEKLSILPEAARLVVVVAPGGMMPYWPGLRGVVKVTALIVHAAANAQRAVDSIMGTTFEDQAESNEESEEEAAVGASFDSYSSAH